jgi:hypothetical protein
MVRKAFSERMKIQVGITGTPAASAEDVLREAQTPPFYRNYRSKDSVDRVVRRSRWWWLRMLIGVGLLCLTVFVGLPLAVAMVWGLLGALLVFSGAFEAYIHARMSAKREDSSK